MSKLPDGRKPIPDEWFSEKAKMFEPEDRWPLVDDFTEIRPFDAEEVKRAIERSIMNKSGKKGTVTE